MAALLLLLPSVFFLALEAHRRSDANQKQTHSIVYIAHGAETEAFDRPQPGHAAACIPPAHHPGFSTAAAHSYYDSEDTDAWFEREQEEKFC